jgi:chaperonin GroES
MASPNHQSESPVRIANPYRGEHELERHQVGIATSSAFPYARGNRDMKIRPLQDRILVKRIEEEAKTSGGIIIPDTAKEKPQEGKVIAVGNGKVLDDGKLHPLDVKKGDRVLFSKYGGTEVQVEGEEHLIIREDDVLGIIEK